MIWVCIGIPGSKMTIYESRFSFEKLQCKNLTSLETRRYICSRIRLLECHLKNGLNILLLTVWTFYKHFSEDFLQISMTIYNFRCLYKILHHLKEYSTWTLDTYLCRSSCGCIKSKMSIYKSIAVLLKFKISNIIINWVAGNFLKIH